MDLETQKLPTDVPSLQSMVTAQALLIEKLKAQIAALKRARFGQKSDALDKAIDQLELALSEVEESAPFLPSEPSPQSEAIEERLRPSRKALPDHLPREEVVHAPESKCASCGAEMRPLGTDVTEVLEYVPARFKVVRHLRPKLSCRDCGTINQASLPSFPIEKGKPGPALLAHVLTSKYCDHLPLYRQSGIYAREGVELSESTLVDWVKRSTELMAPLVGAIGEHAMGGDTLHADDTPIKVLAPGTGRTKTGGLWVYLRNEGDWNGPAPPAALYRYSPDRKGRRPRDHLKSYSGFMHADGYAGFEELYRGGKITEVACLAHARRKFFDIHAASASPIAREALERIAKLYGVEKQARGQSPEGRAAIRTEHATPLFDELEQWLKAQLPALSGKSALAGAIRYCLTRMKRLRVYLGDGRLEIDNNHAERSMRCIALGRKNYLFAGSDAGGERAAAAYTLIETAKLNGLDPQAYLSTVLSSIAAHPINKIDELLPWNIELNY